MWHKMQRRDGGVMRDMGDGSITRVFPTSMNQNQHRAEKKLIQRNIDVLMLSPRDTHSLMAVSSSRASQSGSRALAKAHERGRMPMARPTCGCHCVGVQPWRTNTRLEKSRKRAQVVTKKRAKVKIPQRERTDTRRGGYPVTIHVVLTRLPSPLLSIHRRTF